MTRKGVTARPPSYFAALGVPRCSRWCNLERELVALMYVQALANGGDVWRRLTRSEVRDLLGRDQRGDVRYLRDGIEILEVMFADVDKALSASDVAASVGGCWDVRAPAVQP